MNLGVEFKASNRLGFTLEGDFMRIYTKGRHVLSEPGYTQAWDGARVWSEQKYVTFSCCLSL